MRRLLLLLLAVTWMSAPARAGQEPWRLLDWLTGSAEVDPQIAEFFRLDETRLPALDGIPGGMVLLNHGGAPAAVAWAPTKLEPGLWTWRFQARSTAPGSALLMGESAAFPPSEGWRSVGVTAPGGLPGAAALTLRARQGRLEVRDLEWVRLPFQASARDQGGRLALDLEGRPPEGLQVELRSVPLDRWTDEGTARCVPFQEGWVPGGGAMLLAPDPLPAPFLVKWRLLDREGRVLHSGGTVRLGDPPPTRRGREVRRVEVGPGGVLQVEGQPFLPLGLYTHDSTPAALDAVRDLGLNLALAHPAEGLVEEARRRGLEVILETVVPPEAVAASQVEAFGNLPVLAWTAVDEPDMKPAYQGVLAEVYRAVTAADSRPLYQSNHNPASFPWAATATDILAVDPYPLGTIPRPLTTVGRWVDQARAAAPPGRSVWFINQAFAMAPFWNRPPSPEQLRAMTWIALIHGARGVVYYVLHEILDPGSPGGRWDLRRSPLWEGIRAEAAELRALQGFLLLPEGPERLLFDGPVEGAIWKGPQGALVALVNPLPEVVTVQLDLGPLRVWPQGPEVETSPMFVRLPAHGTALFTSRTE